MPAPTDVIVRRATATDAPHLVRLTLQVQAVHVSGRPDLFKPGGVEDEHLRSRGIGHALWTAVRDTAIAERVDRVILNVWSFNADARRLYEQLGFTPFHERMALEVRRA